jgi:hypothetical protein
MHPFERDLIEKKKAKTGRELRAEASMEEVISETILDLLPIIVKDDKLSDASVFTDVKLTVALQSLYQAGFDKGYSYGEMTTKLGDKK